MNGGGNLERWGHCGRIGDIGGDWGTSEESGRHWREEKTSEKWKTLEKTEGDIGEERDIRASAGHVVSGVHWRSEGHHGDSGDIEEDLDTSGLPCDS